MLLLYLVNGYFIERGRCLVPRSLLSLRQSHVNLLYPLLARTRRHLLLLIVQLKCESATRLWVLIQFITIVKDVVDARLAGHRHFVDRLHVHGINHPIFLEIGEEILRGLHWSGSLSR